MIQDYLHAETEEVQVILYHKADSTKYLLAKNGDVYASDTDFQLTEGESSYSKAHFAGANVGKPLPVNYFNLEFAARENKPGYDHLGFSRI